MFRKITAIVLAFCVVSAVCITGHCEGVPQTGAVAYVLMDALTGDVLLSKNADKTLSMASTTKIMTALLLMEAEEPDTAISITSEMVNVEGSSMGLRAGYTVKRSDLYYGMMLSSGNDAANVTAIHMAGSLDGFSVMMNNKAREIGMTNTSFVTPSGLDSDKHYSTAYDMALLTRYALSNETFRKVSATQSITLFYSDSYHTLTNHNKLLRTYDGCIGVKTGFTSKSGRCLVSAAERNGQTLVCVTLNDYSDWDDHKKLLDYGFSLSAEKQMTFDIPQNADVVGGCSNEIQLRVDSCTVRLFKGQEHKLSYKVNLEPIIYSPVEIGQTVGSVDVYIGDVLYTQKSIITVTGSEYIVPVKIKKSILECFFKIISY